MEGGVPRLRKFCSLSYLVPIFESVFDNTPTNFSRNRAGLTIGDMHLRLNHALYHEDCQVCQSVCIIAAALVFTQQGMREAHELHARALYFRHGRVDIQCRVDVVHHKKSDKKRYRAGRKRYDRVVRSDGKSASLTAPNGEAQ
eukprot:6739667-Prymnesium_polylepis.2